MSARRHRDLASFLEYQYERWAVGRGVRRANVVAYVEETFEGRISPQSFSKWINRERRPTGANLHCLAGVYGPVVYDLVGEPRRLPDDPQLHELIDAYYAATDAGRRQALRILQQNRQQA